MYWNGARLDGMYPASIVSEGIALNITLITYDKNVDFGIMACRRTLPQVQRLIDYMEQALEELEVAAGLDSPKTKSKKRAETNAKSKPKAKSNVKARPKPETKAKSVAKPKPKIKAKAKVKAKAKPKPKAKRGAANRRSK